MLVLCSVAFGQQIMKDNTVPFFGDDPAKKELNEYLDSHINYPDGIPKDSISLVVLMSIVVDVDGSLSDVKIIQSMGDKYPSLEEEILRVFNSMPKWTPHIKQGKPEKMQISFPVLLKFHNEEQ